MPSNTNRRSGWVKAEAAKRARDSARLDAADPPVHFRRQNVQNKMVAHPPAEAAGPSLSRFAGEGL
jgi:hypothetical protein